MSAGMTENIFSSWYVIHTHPRQEDRADRNLRSQEIITFAPKLREHRSNQYRWEQAYRVKPLFPRYIFARFQLTRLLNKVRFTRGVYNVVSFGGCPTPVDDEIINVMQSRLGEDGLISIRSEFEPGDEVIIDDGPLKSFRGIFEREMKDIDRLRILLTTISYQAHVVVERERVRKLETAKAVI
jgi:transcriptional antiterminator RfaH